MKTVGFVALLGVLTGFAIVGGEAVFLRMLPTNKHLAFAIAIGIVAAFVGIVSRRFVENQISTSKTTSSPG